MFSRPEIGSKKEEKRNEGATTRRAVQYNRFSHSTVLYLWYKVGNVGRERDP